MATITITTTGAEDARIVAAFGRKLGLAGNATAAQVKADLREYVKNVVREYEARIAVESAVASVTLIDPQ